MENKKSKIKTALIVLLAVITVVSVVVAVTGKVSSIRLSLARGGEVRDGLLPDVSGHISDVPQGEIRYLINKNMYFEDAFSQGTVMLENPESCEYDLKFNIYSPEGVLIYASPMIKPGQCLEKDKLTAVVKSGEYTCSYSAQAYQNDKLEGQVTGIVTVTVG